MTSAPITAKDSASTQEGTRSELMAENALLRKQVMMLRRSIRLPRVHHDDRLLLLILARTWRRWQDTLHVVKPDTLLGWHRDLFKFAWRRKSRTRGHTASDGYGAF